MGVTLRLASTWTTGPVPGSRAVSGSSSLTWIENLTITLAKRLLNLSTKGGSLVTATTLDTVQTNLALPFWGSRLSCILQRAMAVTPPPPEFISPPPGEHHFCQVFGPSCRPYNHLGQTDACWVSPPTDGSSCLMGSGRALKWLIDSAQIYLYKRNTFLLSNKHLLDHREYLHIIMTRSWPLSPYRWNMPLLIILIFTHPYEDTCRPEKHGSPVLSGWGAQWAKKDSCIIVAQIGY